MTMRAVFLEGRRSMSLRHVPLPEPEDGDVRLRIVVCGVCGSDVSVYKTGAFDGVLGHEIVATVDLDPRGDWEQGTRVIVYPPRGCGACLWCREGHSRYCLDPPQGRLGGYAEYAVYPAANLIAIPPEVDDHAAALADPMGVALRAMEYARPEAGDLAYVNGLGTIGLCTVSALIAVGCRVIGGDPVGERRDQGHSLGCVEVLDPTRTEPYEEALDHDPHGPRLAFECSGNQEGLQQIFDACGHGGTVGVLGIPMGPVLLLRMTVREQQAFSISGPSFGSMAAALDHVHTNPAIASIVGGVIPLEDLPSTMDRLADGSGPVKVLVDPAS